MAVGPGKTNELTVLGENLQAPARLWTSVAGDTKGLLEAERYVDGGAVFRLAVPAETAPAVHALRVATTNGVSSWHLFMVDDLPSASESGTNHTRSCAQELELPMAVDGAADELNFDYFRFRARRNQRVSVEVMAQRLGSLLDPVVRLLDSKGQELVYCDDGPGVGPDARFNWKAPASGQYMLELRDIRYEGGTKHRYRLRVGDFPLADTCFPLAARRGTEVRFSFTGAHVSGVPARTVIVPPDRVILPLGVRFPRSRASGLVSAVISDALEVAEAEPNDTTNTATAVTWPAAVNGRFSRPNDRDWYRFQVSEGERLVFTGQTRSLGSACDLFMDIYNDVGTKVAEAKPTSAEAGSITNRFKEAGTYYLLVEELNQGGGPGLAYRVAIAPFEPGFALTVESDKVETTNGGAFEIKVNCTRREYDGPITLSCLGLGDGFVLENQVIAEKKSETTLKARIPDRFAAGDFAHFNVRGHARVGEAEREIRASTLPALQKLFPDTPYPPGELDGWIVLGIKAAGSAESKPEDSGRRRKK